MYSTIPLYKVLYNTFMINSNFRIMWTTVALIFTTFQIINAKDCACALTKVQILNNDAGFVGVALTGECFQLLGNSNNTWRHIQYQGQVSPRAHHVYCIL